MLLTKEVEMYWCRRYRKRYEEKGYVYTGVYQPFMVKVEDLSRTSHTEVEVKCDYCGKIIKRTYNRYLLHHDEKYGDCCNSCANVKRKVTLSERYGVENVSYLQEVKDKRKQTLIERFGEPNFLKTQRFKEKMDKFLEEHGVENVSQIEEVKNKKKQTCLEHFGVEYSIQSKEVREKRRQTCLEHFGVEHPMQLKEIKEKAVKSFFKNGSCATSKIQLKLYNLLKNNYNICKLNYPLGIYSLDCMIQINNQKIDVEFDGQYWHQNSKDKDDIRDKYCIDNNYKVLRIKGNRILPSIEEIQQNIDKLVTTNCNYLEIYTDWK